MSLAFFTIFNQSIKKTRGNTQNKELNGRVVDSTIITKIRYDVLNRFNIQIDKSICKMYVTFSVQHNMEDITSRVPNCKTVP